MFHCFNNSYQDECCICREHKRIFVTCKICKESKCCEDCSMTMLESGQLLKCPICRQPKWRNNLAPLTAVVPVRSPSVRLTVRRTPMYGDIAVEDIEQALITCTKALVRAYRRLTNFLLIVGVTWMFGMLAFVSLEGEPRNVDQQTWIPFLYGICINIACLCMCNCLTDGACMSHALD